MLGIKREAMLYHGHTASSLSKTKTMNHEVNGEEKGSCEGGEGAHDLSAYMEAEQSDPILVGTPSPRGLVDVLIPQCTNDRDAQRIAVQLTRIIYRIVGNPRINAGHHGGVAIRPVNAADGLAWRLDAPKYILSRTSRKTLDTLIALGTYYVLGTDGLVFIMSDYPEETAAPVHN